MKSKEKRIENKSGGIRKENRFKVYLSVILVAALHALNYQLFVVSNHFAPAGLNGIATMVQYKTGFSIGYMSLIINIPLCLLAFFLIEKRFAVRSFCFSLVYSFVFLGLQHAGLERFQYTATGGDTIFPVIISGVITGFVYGVSLRVSSSTGGIDIISKYVSNRHPKINFFWLTFALNSAIAVASFFVYAVPGPDGELIYNYSPICLCLLYSFISSFVGNIIIKGTKTAAKFTVITSHPDEITKDVFELLKHGVTRLSATGSFRNTETTMLICVVGRHQMVDFQNILKKYDKTFSFCELITETYGNFKRDV